MNFQVKLINWQNTLPGATQWLCYYHDPLAGTTSAGWNPVGDPASFSDISSGGYVSIELMGGGALSAWMDGPAFYPQNGDVWQIDLQNLSMTLTTKGVGGFSQMGEAVYIDFVLSGAGGGGGGGGGGDGGGASGGWVKMGTPVTNTIQVSQVAGPTNNWVKMGNALTATIDVGEAEIPSNFKLVQTITYPDGKKYSGNAQRCLATFSFAPASWPGSTWFIDHTLEQKALNQIESNGEKALTFKLYESGFDYIMVIEATMTKPVAYINAQAQGPLLPWEIICGLILVGLIILFFIIKQVTEFIYKAPAAAISMGLIALGMAGVVVVGPAIYKGSSVKQAVTGKK